MPVGFALLALATGPAADPVALRGPRLAKGDELVYRGEVVETGERVRKTYTLDVRVFVLAAANAGTDCGVMTVLTPQADATVTQAVKVASGRDPVAAAAAPVVRLDLVRVDTRGHVKLLRPAGPPPFEFTDKTPTADPPTVTADGPAAAELGVFLPLPLTAAAVGDTWDTAEADRPPLVWTAARPAVWNGRRVAEVTAVQQTDGYASPAKARHGWKRSETLLVADGLAASVSRTVVRRDGSDTVASVSTTLELQPSERSVGVKYDRTRADVEAAWAFAADADRLRAGRPKAGELEAAGVEVARYLERQATPTPFRPAVEAAGRRFRTGTAPPVAPRIVIEPSEPEPPKVGKVAPDFAVADVTEPTNRVRLSGVGRPAVVVFFKPNSETSEEALTICEALHRRYGERATVLPLALGGDLIAAGKQRAALKYGVPVWDGAEVAKPYAVASYPRFLLIDGAGTVRWAFDAGVGPEVGSLVKKELEKVLAEKAR